MTDAEIIEWLNYWLSEFYWRTDTRQCVLEFKDPYGHLYESTGKDLRDCVANAVTKHPTSLTFMQGTTK